MTGKSVSRLALVLLAIVPGTAGCGDKVARGVATDTLKAVIAYEKAVDAKAAAEKAFYVTQREAIQHRLLGYAAAGKEPPDSRIPAEKTIYYGRLRVAAERDARLVADSVVAGDHQVLAAVIGYLDRGVREEAELRVSLMQRDRDLTIKLLEQLETIDQQRGRLATVREELVTLSQRPGTMKHLQLWLDLGRGVRNSLKSSP